MKLHWSPRSPFVRKVMITLHETGLLERVETERSVVAYAAPPNEDVLLDNPLGKIPTLVRDDGTALFDSRVICEYLDTLHEGKPLLPREGEPRWQHLRWQALGDGLTEILLAWRTELMRPQGPFDVLTAAFERKVRAAMAQLETEADALESTPFGLGHISIVCALGQLDFRFAASGWTEAFPKLAAWHHTVATRPSVVSTQVKDDASPAIVNPAADGITPIDFRVSNQ